MIERLFKGLVLAHQPLGYRISKIVEIFCFVNKGSIGDRFSLEHLIAVH